SARGALRAADPARIPPVLREYLPRIGRVVLRGDPAACGDSKRRDDPVPGVIHGTRAIYRFLRRGRRAADPGETRTGRRGGEHSPGGGSLVSETAHRGARPCRGTREPN